MNEETRILPEGPPRDEIAVAAGYLKIMTGYLAFLNQNNLRSNKGVEMRSASWWNDRYTFVVAGLNDLTTAVMLSGNDASVQRSNGRRRATSVIMPITFSPDGNLFTDGMGGLYSDCFFVCEHGEVKIVKTSSPIPIDTYYDLFTSDKLPNPDEYDAIPGNREVAALTNSKYATTQYLAECGEYVPQEHLIETNVNLARQIQYFAERAGCRRIVIKPNKGWSGHGNRMFHLDRKGALEEAIALAEANLKSGYVLVQERLIPAPIEGDARFGSGVDYNFRTLAVIGKEAGRDNLRYIDHEIRFQPKSDDPVSVTQGAQVARLSPGSPWEQVVREVTERVAAEIYRFAKENGGNPFCLIGLDIIPVQVGNDVFFYVLEVNSGVVGGFSSLCKLQGKPLDTVKYHFIPAFRSLLERNFSIVKPNGPLESLAPSVAGLSHYAEALYYGGNMPGAIKMFEYLAQLHPQNIKILLGLAHLYHEDQMRAKALACIKNALEIDPFNEEVLAMLRQFQK